MGFKLSKQSKIKLKNCTAICGFPGVGNVAKVAIDYLIDAVNAKPLLELFYTKLPSSAMIEYDGLIYLPSIIFYYKKIKNKNFIFVTGSSQPIEDSACYELCDKILNILKLEYNCKEIVTFGGIAMSKLPNKIKVFATGNDKIFIKTFPAKTKNVFEAVGAIIGMAGMLTAMAHFVNIKSVLLLAQTKHGLSYIGFNGSKEILKIINKKYGFNIELKNLTKEAKKFENELRSSLEQAGNKHEFEQILSNIFNQGKRKNAKKDMNYFG